MDAAFATPAEVPVRTIPLALIAPDPRNPRKAIDPAQLQELADSIRAHGVVQPIVVRSKLDTANGADTAYQIIAGERRWRASALAGKTDIVAIVRDDLSEQDITVLQLVENFQRADLSLIDEAAGCDRLVELVGLDAAAREIGKSKSWVSQRANLLELDRAIVELIEAGKLTSVDMAHDLHALANTDEQGAEQVSGWLEDIGKDLPPTREEVRQELRYARGQAELEKQREAEEAQARIERASEGGELFTAPDDGDDDEARPARPATPKSFSASKLESQWDRERRLREEAWAALMPECRQTQRDIRKAILGALDSREVKRSKNFELTVSLPRTDRDAPAKASGAQYCFEVRGGTQDAGVVLEALAPNYKVDLNIKVTVHQLRQIEDIIFQPLPVRCTSYDWQSDGGPKVHGSQVAKIDAKIAEALAARQPSAKADPKPKASASKTRPKPGTEARSEAIATVTAFAKACTQKAKHVKVRQLDLHAAYVAYCQRHGLHPMSLQDSRWADALRAAGIEQTRRKDGRWCIGIALLVEAG